ncbi:MAG: hypothetical protein OXT67_13325 [Zetaproteobacteria bacterium]|nr:hypothetical protein [Zetaproteobacteria bacterium]
MLSSTFINRTRCDVAEFARIGFPLVISLASTGFLILGDRYIVSLYSTEAMNFSALAGNLFFAVTAWLVFMAASSEYFVGQHNGRGESHLLMKPVWQMLLLVLGFTPLICVLALLVGEWAFPVTEVGSFGRSFFYALLPLGTLSGMVTALSGFFLGQKQVWLVSVIALCTNIMNFVLDWYFVFGLKGWFAGWGPLGAAYATDIVVLMQVIALLLVILRQCQKRSLPFAPAAVFEKAYLSHLVRVSLPSALGHSVEVWAHSFLVKMISVTSVVHMTTFTVVHSVYLVIFFACEALHKTAATLAANAVGAQEYEKIRRILYASFFFCGCIGTLALAAFGLHGLEFTRLLLAPAEASELDTFSYAQVLQQSYWSLLLLSVFAVVDGMALTLAGVLSACGQTRVIMWGQGGMVWCLYVLPAAFVCYVWHWPPVWTFVFFTLYVSWLVAFYAWRLRGTSADEMHLVRSPSLKKGSAAGQCIKAGRKYRACS